MATLKNNTSKTRIEVTDGALIPERSEKTTFISWIITIVGAVALLVILPLVSPNPFWTILQFIPDGVLNTFKVTLTAIFFALILGLITGLGRISRSLVLNIIATIYVEVIRGIPLLVQLFYIYYGLGFLGLSPFISAVTAMSICYGAYMGEIFRAGIQSIPKGQMEAALALGLSRGQALRYVILPQTMRVILPPIGNEFIALLKDSSLVSILAVSDLLRRGREYASTSFKYFETFSMVALVYLVLTLLLSWLVAFMEDKLGTSHGK